MPAYTIAGASITAGENVDPNQPIGPVITGEAEVVFKAPEINLEEGFDAGPNFDAITDEQTCIDDCEDCCDYWNGFTFDYIPNVFTPNGDGVNDYWYIPDQSNSFCAFNAKNYVLHIVNVWGDYVRVATSSNVMCCPFKAPGPNNDIPHSTIYWDGTVNGGPMASNGVYYYVLVLQGCGSSAAFTGVIHLLDGGRSYTSEIEQYSDREVFSNISKNDSLFQLLSDTTLIGADKQVSFHSATSEGYISTSMSDSTLDISGSNPSESFEEQIFSVYPNPSNNYFWVDANFKNYVVRVFNASGQIVYSQNSLAQVHKIDLSSQSDGVYLIQILSNSNLFTKYIIKI